MKKTLLTLAITAATQLSATAQRYVIINDRLPIEASQVERITYEAYPEFYNFLLAGQIATDEQTTLFSQALQLTHLSDTLSAYIYHADYRCPWDRYYYYTSDYWREVATYNLDRPRRYTVFAETDEVFRAAGISTLDDLQRYASRVYDALYPEDAGVSDPTDRRNALNRFVAYHILPFEASYHYLTIYDGYQLERCVNRDLTDIAAWYSTLMPHAVLKCSYPKTSDAANAGIYLNRLGLKDGADRYGHFVRGAKIVPFNHPDGSISEDRVGPNGCYYHIDRVLAYDEQTRDEVLSGELWRVDFKTLSPDIMNYAPDLRGNYMYDDNSTTPDLSFKNGRNIVFDWQSMDNITTSSDSTTARFVHRRAHCNFWSWQGDEVNIFGDFDMTVRLPQLPAGEWEVRLGYCAMKDRSQVKVFLNDTETVDTLDMRKFYYEYTDDPRIMHGPQSCVHFSQDYNFPFYDPYDAWSTNNRLVRYRLGRVQSDGKRDNYLRLQTCKDPENNNPPMVMLDYIELVPAAVADNTETPEE